MRPQDERTEITTPNDFNDYPVMEYAAEELFHFYLNLEVIYSAVFREAPLIS